MKHCQHRHRRPLLCLALALLAGAAGGGEWLREIEIRPEEEANGQRDFTVRFLPDKTADYEAVIFECVLQQKFPWEDARGRKYTKVHEPMTFTYRRPDVQLVNDLDFYISFRVPIGLDRLERMYGERVFNKGFPVTVPRMRITAKADGKTLWSHELPAHGLHNVAELEKPRAPDAEGALKDLEDLDREVQDTE